MKRYLFIAVLILSSCQLLFSQQLYFEIGKSISSFDYHDSRFNTLDNMYASNHSFISMGFRQRAIEDFLFASVALDYNTYGAIASDREVDNYMEWEATYLGVIFGLDFKVWHIKKMQFYIKGTFSPEFIIQGTQVVNNQVYDLVGADDFDKTAYFFRGGAFLTYPINNQTHFFVQYMGGKSKSLKSPTTLPDREKLRLKSHNLGFGLIINLINNK